MDRYKRAIRKDRKQRAKERHAPKIDADRAYQTQLVVFEAIVECTAEANAKQLNDQQRARLADHKAAKAAEKVKEIWSDAD